MDLHSFAARIESERGEDARDLLFCSFREGGSIPATDVDLVLRAPKRPLSRFTTRPSYVFASTTQTPLGATKTWSMLRLVPGIRRSCNAITRSPTSRAMKAARRDSPSLPFCQVAAASRSATCSATTAARSPCCARTRLTREEVRRAASAAADAPGAPPVWAAPLAAQVRQVACFDLRFQTASVVGGRAIPQAEQVPAYRRRSWRVVGLSVSVME